MGMDTYSAHSFSRFVNRTSLHFDEAIEQATSLARSTTLPAEVRQNGERLAVVHPNGDVQYV